MARKVLNLVRKEKRELNPKGDAELSRMGNQEAEGNCLNKKPQFFAQVLDLSQFLELEAIN